MTKNLVKLFPPDYKRCQAEIPTKHSFMTLGPTHEFDRCQNLPSVIATEKKKSKDGRLGSMSLCAQCFEVMQKQMPNFATFKVIQIARAEGIDEE